MEGGLENDIGPWEESCLAKFSEFLGSRHKVSKRKS